VRIPSSDKTNKKKRDPTAYNCFVKSQVKKGANMKVCRTWKQVDLESWQINDSDGGLLTGHHVNFGIEVEGAICRGEEGLFG